MRAHEFRGPRTNPRQEDATCRRCDENSAQVRLVSRSETIRTNEQCADNWGGVAPNGTDAMVPNSFGFASDAGLCHLAQKLKEDCGGRHASRTAHIERR